MPIGLEALKLREEAAQRTGVFDDLIVVSISDSHFIYSYVGMVLRNPASQKKLWHRSQLYD